MNPLLKMAILAGTPDLVQFHLQRGGDANHLDKDGVSPLMYAATRGQVEICRILLEAGADPFLKNRQGQDALALARLAGHRAVETMLLEAVSKSLGHGIPDEPDAAVHSPLDFPEFDGAGWGPRTLLTS
ncbi:MAG: ankyrin repeat domain-containing protein [Candidatus Contendobacter sp.]